MYTLVEIVALLSSAVTYVDGYGIPERFLAQLTEPFFVGFYKISENILAFSREGVTFMKIKVDRWTVDNGVVKFTTPKGNQISLASPSLVNPFRFTKVVYHYTEIHNEIPEWYHGSASFCPQHGGYELNLVDSFFVPDGEWNEEYQREVASLKDEGNFIYKGEYLVREELLDKMQYYHRKYNSYGEFGFSSRKAAKKEALLLARDRNEKDFIRWYLSH